MGAGNVFEKLKEEVEEHLPGHHHVKHNDNDENQGPPRAPAQQQQQQQHGPEVSPNATGTNRDDAGQADQAAGGHDSAFEKARVVHDSERPVHTGGTYPRLCRLPDGSLLCGVTQFQKPNRVLAVSRSTDGGASFAPLGEVARKPGDCDNVFLLAVPDTDSGDGAAAASKQQAGPQGQHGHGTPAGHHGQHQQQSTVLAAFRNHDMDPHSGKFSVFRITVCRSRDGGHTWQFLAQAVERSAAESKGMGVWEPFMRLGKQGQIEMTYSSELAPDNQETFRVVSHDGGQTWTAPHCLRCHPPSEHLRDGMQGIVTTHDRARGDREADVIVFETTRNGTFSVEYAVSYDGGDVWDQRALVYSPKPGRNAGSPQIAKYGHDGLVVIFMCDEDVPNVQWPGTAAVKACFGSGLRAGRITWSKPRLVCPASSHWPGLIRVGDQDVLAVYEKGNKPLGKLLHWPGP